MTDLHERHREDCPGGDLCTLRITRAYDACQARGWGVGTVLEGTEDGTTRRIRILYLSAQTLLAADVGGAHDGHEGSWTLWCRCWGEVSRAE